jgi:hypothetical protein
MISGLKPLNATAPLIVDFDRIADIGIAQKSRAILPSVGNLGELTRHQANTSETLSRFSKGSPKYRLRSSFCESTTSPSSFCLCHSRNPRNLSSESGSCDVRQVVSLEGDAR